MPGSSVRPPGPQHCGGAAPAGPGGPARPRAWPAGRRRRPSSMPSGLRAVGDGVHTHRGDQQVAPHPGPFRGVGQQDGGAAVDGVLAAGAAARAGAGGEHDRVGAGRRRRRSSTEARSRSSTTGIDAVAAQVGLVRRGCGRCRRRCRRGWSGAAEAAGDLPVGAGDHDAHGPALPRSSGCRYGGQSVGLRKRGISGRAGGRRRCRHGPVGRTRRRWGQRPRPGRGPGRRGCRSRSTAAGVPGSDGAGGSGRRRAGRAPGAAASDPRAAARPERSAAVRQTPSRYWSRPPSSTTRTPSSRQPRRAARRPGRGQERQVAGEHGDRRPCATSAGRPAAPAPGRRPAGCSRTSTTPAGTGWGGPTTIRCCGVGDGGQHRARASSGRRPRSCGFAWPPSRAALPPASTTAV